MLASVGCPMMANIFSIWSASSLPAKRRARHGGQAAVRQLAQKPRERTQASSATAKAGAAAAARWQRTREERLAGEQLKHDAASAPHVNLSAVLLGPEQQLRRPARRHVLSTGHARHRAHRASAHCSATGRSRLPGPKRPEQAGAGRWACCRAADLYHSVMTRLVIFAGFLLMPSALWSRTSEPCSGFLKCRAKPKSAIFSTPYGQGKQGGRLRA